VANPVSRTAAARKATKETNLPAPAATVIARDLFPAELACIASVWEATQETGSPVPLDALAPFVEAGAVESLGQAGILRAADEGGVEFTQAGLALFVDASSSALLRTDTVPLPTKEAAPPIRSYKVAVYGAGESKPAYNGLRFATAQDAEAWGRDLHSRWTGCARFEVHESEDSPNRPDSSAAAEAKPQAVPAAAPQDSKKAPPVPTAAREAAASDAEASASGTAPPAPRRVARPAKSPADTLAEMRAAAALSDADLAAARRAQDTGVASPSAVPSIPAAARNSEEAPLPSPITAPKMSTDDQTTSPQETTTVTTPAPAKKTKKSKPAAAPQQAAPAPADAKERKPAYATGTPIVGKESVSLEGPAAVQQAAAPKKAPPKKAPAPKPAAGPVLAPVATGGDSLSAQRMAAQHEKRAKTGKPMPWGKRKDVILAMRRLGAYSVDSARTAEDIAEESGTLRKVDVVHYNYKDNELVCYGLVALCPPGSREDLRGLGYYLTEKGRTIAVPQ
jgi:hypothetical protein